ncbi:hypothetical protein GCM10010358_73710 [Streptomyces minutiscleroticus]|uniref:Transposase n=1 Tax=Streptomyces minutiscleroticus TaxID=68238 RepID=A0A918P0J8_9ACTN|nr:hypothetical protein [Streptomyces minutiscleroticus]GGY10408.1 hypothetical protein GCM10010358_73710 [Streptomyces minutiscleroticus]
MEGLPVQPCVEVPDDGHRRDGHKRTRTSVAADELGRCQDGPTVAATTEGHGRALSWIGRFGPQILVAVEDCRHLTPRFEVDLLTAGHQAVRVHTRLMAGARRSARERGKSDPLDAQAVARATLREPGPAPAVRTCVPTCCRTPSSAGVHHHVTPLRPARDGLVQPGDTHRRQPVYRAVTVAGREHGAHRVVRG